MLPPDVKQYTDPYHVYPYENIPLLNLINIFHSSAVHFRKIRYVHTIFLHEKNLLYDQYITIIAIETFGFTTSSVSQIRQMLIIYCLLYHLLLVNLTGKKHLLHFLQQMFSSNYLKDTGQDHVPRGNLLMAVPASALQEQLAEDRHQVRR